MQSDSRKKQKKVRTDNLWFFVFLLEKTSDGATIGGVLPSAKREIIREMKDRIPPVANNFMVYVMAIDTKITGL